MYGSNRFPVFIGSSGKLAMMPLSTAMRTIHRRGVNISARSNIYEATAEGVIEVFESFVAPPSRDGGCLAVAASEHQLSETAANAIEKSLDSLGYGVGRCAFVSRNADGLALGGGELTTIIEGLDPLCLVVADGDCASALEQGYHTALERDKANRLLGRPCIVFRSFEPLLETADGKQKAWALLKQLPRL